jgi:hypothetical protein
MTGVSNDQCETAQYEAPQIERRTEIGPMLIGVLLSSNLDN